MPYDGVTAEWAVCRRGCHTLDLPRLRLQTPTLQDMRIAAAAASDPEAQRWFGWRPKHVTPARRRDRLLTRRPGRGRPVRRPVADYMGLVAVDRTSGMVAGSVGVQIDTGELGGWPAPPFRSRGLGGELFAGGAFFARGPGSPVGISVGYGPELRLCMDGTYRPTLLRRLGEMAVDGGAGDAELVGDLLDGVVAGVVHLARESDLAGAELGFLAAGAAPGAGGFESVHRPLRHQGLLELGDRAEDLEEHPADRGGGFDALVQDDQRPTPRFWSSFDSSMRFPASGRAGRVW